MRVLINDTIYNCHAVQKIDLENDYILRIFFSEKSYTDTHFPSRTARNNSFNFLYNGGCADLSRFTRH